MSSRNVRLTGWRLAGVVAATTFVVTGAAVGAAGAPVSPYTVPLDPSTPTPIAAATFSKTGSCDGIVPPNLDGWHFAVTDGVTEIVGLNLTFNSPIGALGIIYTSDRQQAYVATLPGVQLTQASALVTTPAGTPQVQSFELANTCPAQAGTQAPFGLSTASPSPFPGSVLPTGTGTPIPPSLQVTNTNPASPSATATRSASPTCSPTPTPTASATPTRSASATPTASASASATPTATPTASATPTATRTASASATPTPAATRTASASATPTPTTSVSAAPTCSPTAAASPTASPTSSTGAAPTPSPVASSLPVTG